MEALGLHGEVGYHSSAFFGVLFYMKPRIKKKLLYKLLIFVLPLLIFSILFTSLVLSWTNYNYFLKNIEQDYSNIIRSSAGEIRLYMENARKGLEGLALVLSATKPDMWQKEMALTAFQHTTDDFMSISLVSLDGKEILSARREGGNIDFIRDETFNEVRAGYSAISDLKRTKENIPYIDFAVPVMHMGKVEEILWGELNLKTVWDVLEGIRVGKTGQVFILDLSGRFIGHREMDRVIRSDLAVKQEILKKLYETDTTVHWVEEKNGGTFYCLGSYIPSLDWVVVLSQAYPEIHANVYQNIYWVILLTGLIGAIAIVLAWKRTKQFLIPIDNLHHQVIKIGQGNFDQTVSIESDDEIGDLGLAFNNMLDSLKRFIQREVETAKELVQAKNLAILGTTSSKVTHEVGNLLNNVGLTLSVLEKESLSQDGEKALDITRKDTQRVKRFIQNFLQFAKAPELKLEKVSLLPLIHEIVSTYKSDAKNRRICINMDWPDQLPMIHVDSHLIYQVFNNLRKNSLEAMMPPGAITIKGERNEGHIFIHIEDTGPGMDPKVVSQIFDPFFTTKGKKGAGLGLSIVKTIVEAHHGVVTCHSELGKGTRFTIQLNTL